MVASPVSAVVEVAYIPARSYFEVVQRELKKARTSITVCQYLFNLRSSSSAEVFRLAETLKEAFDAGVRVEVLLDQNRAPGEEGAVCANGPAYAYLKAQGVPVFYDDAGEITHAKAIVIDEETVILGSSNWTDSALAKNLETNVLIRSRAVARELIAELRRIPRESPPPLDDRGTDVPASFFDRPDLFGRMAASADERALDLYLFLLTQSTSAFMADYHAMATALGLQSMTREAFRRQINKTLAKLQNRYGLIRVETAFNQDARVTWMLLEETGFVRVPSAYWERGWSRRLTLAGKCFFLINRYESAVSLQRPRWSVARTTLARRYGVSPAFITQGLTELRRYNLMEVEYAPLSKDGGPARRPSIYTPAPLYDMAQFDQAMRSLAEKHGAEAVSRARRAAALVYEDFDREGIAELVALEERFGRDRIAQALAVVGKKNVDNPKRSLPYLLGVIRQPPRPAGEF